MSRPGLNYLGAKQWLWAVSALCPTSPCVFQASSLALVSSSKKDSELPQGSLPPGPPTGSGGRPGRLLGNLTQFWGKQATVLERHRPHSQPRVVEIEG